MYEDIRRRALEKEISDSRTPLEALEIARARVFELQKQLEDKAVDASDMSEYDEIMAARDGVSRAWLLIDNLIDQLKQTDSSEW